MSREIMLIENKEGNWQEPFATICIESKEEFDELNKALEKQKPKKVEEFMERTEEFSSFYKLDFMCPSCENATICQPYRPNYCKHCGQKLDWGD